MNPYREFAKCPTCFGEGHILKNNSREADNFIRAFSGTCIWRYNGFEFEIVCGGCLGLGTVFPKQPNFDIVEIRS